jgi:hypothetical protein
MRAQADRAARDSVYDPIFERRTGSMTMFKRLFVYVVLMTWLLALLDWKPIHYAWWHYGEYPAYARDWQTWTNVRMWTSRILCPPCAPLAENYYYVLMEVEAGTDEQRDVLQAEYSGNPVAPHGYKFYWGQGDGQAWRPVSMLSLYLYWLPSSVIWWLVVGDLFRMKRPWWWTRWLPWSVPGFSRRIAAGPRSMQPVRSQQTNMDRASSM